MIKPQVQEYLPARDKYFIDTIRAYPWFREMIAQVDAGWGAGNLERIPPADHTGG